MIMTTLRWAMERSTSIVTTQGSSNPSALGVCVNAETISGSTTTGPDSAKQRLLANILTLNWMTKDEVMINVPAIGTETIAEGDTELHAMMTEAFTGKLEDCVVMVVTLLGEI
jgi:hypothetical protein